MKVLLRIWWDWKGIIYYKLLPYGQTLNSNIYCQLLDSFVIDQKRTELANRRGVLFHQDNARPHKSVVTRQKLWELDWEVLMHPPYCPDPAPSDFHLFLSLQNFLGDKKLGSREDFKNRSQEAFSNKDEYFYERGLLKLPLKWQQILQLNGAYLTKSDNPTHVKVLNLMKKNRFLFPQPNTNANMMDIIKKNVD
ncbi:histone-lysine N-methyltransferase SETMAR [Trichonephila clavipes]|nr:histone-lysine N-methyltransferase SETMAR [Trichonephila clavipes]